MKAWWITFVVWFAIFCALSVTMMVRQYDGSGLYQTPELKLVSILVLAVVFLPILVAQIIWLIILRRRNKH